jgi:ComF family protein
VIAAGEFDGPLRQAIHSLKYRGQRAGAPALAALLAPPLAAALGSDHLLVPVPLHPRRQRSRGYNQSTLLAHALATGGRAAMADGAMRRIRMTARQVDLRAEERARNMDGAFAADPAHCARRTIALIDDVCTTGATLRAAAQAALNAGADRVYAAVLAAAQPGRDR